MRKMDHLFSDMRVLEVQGKVLGRRKRKRRRGRKRRTRHPRYGEW
jgi:hypothetical protein